MVSQVSGSAGGGGEPVETRQFTEKIFTGKEPFVLWYFLTLLFVIAGHTYCIAPPPPLLLFK